MKINKTLNAPDVVSMSDETKFYTVDYSSDMEYATPYIQTLSIGGLSPMDVSNLFNNCELKVTVELVKRK